MNYDVITHIQRPSSRSISELTFVAWLKQDSIHQDRSDYFQLNVKQTLYLQATTAGSPFIVRFSFDHEISWLQVFWRKIIRKLYNTLIPNILLGVLVRIFFTPTRQYIKIIFDLKWFISKYINFTIKKYMLFTSKFPKPVSEPTISLL